MLGRALIVSIPLAGYIAQRVNRPNLLMTLGFGLVALAAFALPFISAFMTTFFLIAVVAGLPAGADHVACRHKRCRRKTARSVWGCSTVSTTPAWRSCLRSQAVCVISSGSPASPSSVRGSDDGVCVVGLFAFRLAQVEAELILASDNRRRSGSAVSMLS